MSSSLGPAHQECSVLRSLYRATAPCLRLMEAAVCRRALGWLAAELDICHEELRLRSLLPSSDRAGVSHAFDYSQFLLNERHVSPYTQGMGATVSRLDTPRGKAGLH